MLKIVLLVLSVLSADYKQLVNQFNSPAYPKTIISRLNNNSISFTSIAAASDPSNKYRFVLHDANTIPTWLFLMRTNGKIKDELWHRGIHNGNNCNVVNNNKMLLHLKTIGFFKTDIIFRVNYFVSDIKNGTIATINLDKSYLSEEVSEFRAIFWVFPHPTIKGLVIIVCEGYIKTPATISMLENNIKWHIDSALFNLGERFGVVK